MTTYAVERGRRAWSTLPRARAWLEEVRPAKLLVPAIAIQWLATLGLALTVRHNGWIFYQGGDQLWYYGSGWALAHGQIPTTLVAQGWPALLAPVARLAGPTLVPALPVIVLLNVLVLGPAAILCMYGIGKQLGGKLFGFWVTLLWLVVPFIGIQYTDHLYHQRYTELTLPQAFGLTAMADFPSTVAVLVCVYFALRVIAGGDRIQAVAAGLAAGAAVAVKPSNSVFVVGVALGLVYRRRLVPAAFVLAGAAPALVTLALWKYRGFGYLPLFHSAAARTIAFGAHEQLVGFNPLHKYVTFDWHQLNINLQAIKEHFWSVRVIEWLVFAGLIGLARRSVTALLVVGGWFAAFVVTKGTYPHAGIDDASVFRIMMPAYPAFVLMLGALVYLVPRGRRARARLQQEPPRPAAPARRRRRLALLAAAAAAFSLYPLALVAVASPQNGVNPRVYSSVGLLRTIDPGLRLDATVSGKRVHLTWTQRKPAAARVFFRIWRSNEPDGGAHCVPVPHGASDCELTMEDMGAHGGGTWIDTPRSGHWTYRLGLAANWLDDPSYGDVYSLGPPVAVVVH